MNETEFDIKKNLIKKYHKKQTLAGLKKSLQDLEKYNAKKQLRPMAEVAFEGYTFGSATYDKITITPYLDLLDHKDYILAYQTLQHESWHVFQYYISSLDFNNFKSDEIRNDIINMRVFNNYHYVPVSPTSEDFTKKNYIKYRYGFNENQARQMEIKLLIEDYKKLQELGYSDSEIEKQIKNSIQDEEKWLDLCKKYYGEDYFEKFKEEVIQEGVSSLKSSYKFTKKKLEALVRAGLICGDEEWNLYPEKISNKFKNNAERIYTEWTK